METKHFQKVVHRIKLFLALQSFSCHFVNIRVYKYVFTHVAIKIKIFHSCRTRVFRVALLSLSCLSCSTRVALVLHSCCLCLTRVASVTLVLHSCWLCRTRVSHVWHSCCKLDQIIKEYRCLKNVIHQIDSKNEWLLHSDSFTAKFGLVFVLPPEDAFSQLVVSF